MAKTGGVGVKERSRGGSMMANPTNSQRGNDRGGRGGGMLENGRGRNDQAAFSGRGRPTNFQNNDFSPPF